MIPGINIIDFTQGIWTAEPWSNITSKLQQAYDRGFGAFRIWVHFNYSNTIRDEQGSIGLAPAFVDHLHTYAPEWPGEIVFDWSWGYHNDKLGESWLWDEVSHFFPDEQPQRTVADRWVEDWLAQRFHRLYEEWEQLLLSLGDERFSLSIGNEVDGLIQSAVPSEQRETFLHILGAYPYPFTAGWRNEYSFQSDLLRAIEGKGPARFSYYEHNDDWAAQAGMLEASPVVQLPEWGVAEFGIQQRNTTTENIEAMRERIQRFRDAGARDVFLWSLGAGDHYEWQFQDEEYALAFVAACLDLDTGPISIF